MCQKYLLCTSNYVRSKGVLNLVYVQGLSFEKSKELEKSLEQVKLSKTLEVLINFK